MAIVLLRSQFSTDSHSGAALAEAEYDGHISVSLYRKSEKNSGRIYCRFQEKYGVYPGVETPITPDDPDVLDGGDGVKGVGGEGLATGCRVCRVVLFDAEYITG
jgi:hypothetical protein